MRKSVFLFLTTLFVSIGCNRTAIEGIRPYDDNRSYWEYEGKPVLLLGATNNDNLFQSRDIKEQLDTLAAVGGNYIRNTMSSRDSGNVWPFYQQADGTYDLDEWNPSYWDRFSTLLGLAAKRGVIVQIEIWDRFDYSRGPWQLNPFNPQNNINYTVKESGLEPNYPHHPYRDLQPFFHSIKSMSGYKPELEIVRRYQEKFVNKLLSYSLLYDNILYCMNNETSTPLEWGQYWIKWIRKRAAQQNKTVYTTDMFDHVFTPRQCRKLDKAVLNDTIYTFLDISQINSRNVDQAHWDSLTWILERTAITGDRPVNNTKVYGGPQKRDIFGSVEDGVEKFCRDIMAGCGSARFHRPPAGNGLSSVSKNTIRAIRKIETRVKFWQLSPQMHLLGKRSDDEAYLSADLGKRYLIYFPADGHVTLDLRPCSGETYQLQWINIQSGCWGERKMITGGARVEIKPPGKRGWFALFNLYREENR